MKVEHKRKQQIHLAWLKAEREACMYPGDVWSLSKWTKYEHPSTKGQEDEAPSSRENQALVTKSEMQNRRVPWPNARTCLSTEQPKERRNSLKRDIDQPFLAEISWIILEGTKGLS